MAYRYDLTKEEEVKKYLDNVLVEYQFQCLQEKLPDGCGRLGDYYFQVRPDLEKSAKLHKENCDKNNYGHSCYRYGSMLLQGLAGKKDIPEGYKYLEKSCEQGIMKSCYNVAVMTSNPDKQFYDIKKAIELFQRACVNKHERSCLQLVNIFLNGNKDIAIDKEKAFHYADYGCNERGSAPLCARLYYMYRRGVGVEQNKEMALMYKKKSQILANQGPEGYRHQMEMGE
ncbi:hypothetical protein FSP39_007561 [Pinctada imbricata]|uniref:Uncharacterized protein n=1 Tax=Pinctada imbricata TaxID=66713 RepID=A0AA89C0T8_PINIB|nr:hypothetical protein FSP39_007561 [Pinctada imbricata]